MKSFIRGVRRFWRDEEGANGIEYALLAALIAVAFIGGASLLGNGLNNFFTTISGCLTAPSATCMSGP